MRKYKASLTVRQQQAISFSLIGTGYSLQLFSSPLPVAQSRVLPHHMKPQNSDKSKSQSRLTAEQYEELSLLLKLVSNSPDAQYFKNDPDEILLGWPGYHRLTQDHLFLNDIERKLRLRGYADEQEFIGDLVSLMFNMFSYHRHNPETKKMCMKFQLCVFNCFRNVVSRREDKYHRIRVAEMKRQKAKINQQTQIKRNQADELQVDIAELQNNILTLLDGSLFTVEAAINESVFTNEEQQFIRQSGELSLASLSNETLTKLKKHTNQLLNVEQEQQNHQKKALKLSKARNKADQLSALYPNKAESSSFDSGQAFHDDSDS